MNQNPWQPRHHDGRYGFAVKSEADETLVGASDPDVDVARALADLGERGTDELWPHVTSDHPAVRSRAAAHLDLDDEQASTLAGDPDPVVRLDMAALGCGDADTREALLRDANPVVRLRASQAPDVPEPVRQRILADPAVARVVSRAKGEGA